MAESLTLLEQYDRLRQKKEDAEADLSKLDEEIRGLQLDIDEAQARHRDAERDYNENQRASHGNWQGHAQDHAQRTSLRYMSRRIDESRDQMNRLRREKRRLENKMQDYDRQMDHIWVSMAGI